ncbi:methyltransferase domain-containing protein [Paraburkholderia agricolaris]|uniref:methyltransferase domain-containing protein n=1 Tax=Paraburkholderia agricolaris TaxID=2152888 RepID=UPI00129107A1|nr:methyltransferase domain-containing protein [Paraburkholderia agricolaris]
MKQTGAAMERIKCLICGGPTDGRPATIAPFLVKYCNFDQKTTETRYCRSCDFVFFRRRLTDAEASRLYTNYRGEEYNRIRLGVEPSYSSFIDLFDNPLSTYYTERIRDYIGLVDAYPELGEIKNILDFGGDGSIPARVFPNAEIEIDDLNAGSSANRSKYQMIFTSNVFEHLSDPVPVLKKLTDRLDPEGIIFIDVPSPSQPNLGEGLLWQQKHGGELYEMHEHITHFSKRSLGLLVHAAGMVPLFEHKLRYPVLTVLAGFEDSAVATKLLNEKYQRAAVFEAKMAREEAEAAHDHVLDSIRLSHRLSQQISQLSGDGTRWTSEQSASLELQSASLELQSVYRSTSWRVTAPLRVLKNLLCRFAKLGA